jgi:hypothetical protein
LEAPSDDDGVHDVAAKGFVFFWPLRLMLRGRREVPVKVGNIFGRDVIPKIDGGEFGNHLSRRGA